MVPYMHMVPVFFRSCPWSSRKMLHIVETNFSKSISRQIHRRKQIHRLYNKYNNTKKNKKRVLNLPKKLTLNRHRKLIKTIEKNWKNFIYWKFFKFLKLHNSAEPKNWKKNISCSQFIWPLRKMTAANVISCMSFFRHLVERPNSYFFLEFIAYV